MWELLEQRINWVVDYIMDFFDPTIVDINPDEDFLAFIFENM